MSPTFQALAVRNYRIYWMGGLVSNTGTWMQRVAQDWLVLTAHATPAAPSGSRPACSSCRSCSRRRTPA